MQLPPPCQSIERTDKLTVLGVVINDRMTAADHVGYLLSSCSSLLYMLRTLRNHGTPRSVAEGHLPSNSDGKMCTVLQHGPAFVQQPTERKLMLSYEDARDLVTVN